MNPTPEKLYNDWLNIFLNNGIPYENEIDIIHFQTYDIYTPYTYKFTYNFPLSNNLTVNAYDLTNSYKLFADLFFTDGWKEELDYNGDIRCCVKNWIDYVTFQGYRTIIQFRWDKYLISLRKEKLQKLSKQN